MIRAIQISLATAIGFFCLAHAWSQSAPAAASNLTAVGFAPGDTLSVTFYDLPDLNGGVNVVIAADGTVHLPYAGTVKIGGMSPSEAEIAIEHSLQSKNIVKDPSVSIKVLSSSNYVVYLTGQISRPGPVPLLAPAPLSYVLAQGGAFTGVEGKHIVILHRNSKLPESIDYDSMNMTQSAMNTKVVPGDVVRVAPTDVYYMIGEVGRQGIYPLTGGISAGNGLVGTGIIRNMTLLQALAYAGGITQVAARSQALIIRPKPDGTREIIHFDILKLEKGQIADPLIQANDIIFVPSSYLRNLTNNIFSNLVNGLYVLPIVTSTIQNP